MANPERSAGKEKKNSSFMKNLGKIALFAFGLAIGAEVANSDFFNNKHMPKI